MSDNLALIVAAAGPDWVIGRDGRLPWHLPDDMAWFRRATLGKTVVMGRKTWDSLQLKPLPGRRNIVLTRHPEQFQPIAGVLFCDDPHAAMTGCCAPEALAAAGRASRGAHHAMPHHAMHGNGSPIRANIVVIGGAEIYRVSWPLADELAVTWLPSEVPGDCCFPAFERRQWREGMRCYVPAGESAFSFSGCASSVPRRVTLLRRRA